jgi:hypothetical protein
VTSSKLLSQYSPEETEENHKQFEIVYVVPRARFELGTLVAAVSTCLISYSHVGGQLSLPIFLSFCK